MLKDTLNSILDNVKERTTNPFLGTLAIVYLFKNWKLIYSLFYFDSKLTLEKRLLYIEDYFKYNSFLSNLISVVLWTVLILVITYILLSLSRLLTDFYDKVVVRQIARMTDSSSVVLKSEYKTLENTIRELEQRLSEERMAKIGAQSDRDNAERTLKEHVEQQNIEKGISPLTEQQVELNKLSDAIQKEYDVKYAKDILRDAMLGDGTLVKDPKLISFLTANNLMSYSSTNGIRKHFQITELGRKLAKLLDTINS